MDVEAESPHERTPMIFGSAHEVECIEHYFLENHMRGAGSQLFGQRGLFRH